IIEGFEDGSFRPDDTTTRAEVTTILLRYANVEGKKADQYKALNELREVGTTGTNVTSLTSYFYTKNLKGITNTFSNILEKQITLKNKSGSYKIHHVIVVDTEGAEGTGVYASMFVDSVPKVFYGKYLVYLDLSLISYMDQTDMNTLANGLLTPLTSFARLPGSKVNDYGLSTIPGVNQADFFLKNEEKRVWTISYIEKNPSSSIGYPLTTDSGDDVRIFLKK
ncbi:S-layer homology domain-containing protein, partial [Paenibacillus marchantiophytorum]|uniref:S-layer homology domain-containing protein n=1 Tax=Paenibacillus marchantiophytorum TaxID=1619310 RepID=UPI00166F1CCB